MVDKELLRQGNRHFIPESLRICEHTGQCRSCSCLRADQIDLAIRSTGTAFKVAVEGAQGDPFGIRGLAHTDTRTAGAFQNTGSCSDQICQSAILRQHIVNLLGTRGNGQAYIRMNRLAF